MTAHLENVRVHSIAYELSKQLGIAFLEIHDLSAHIVLSPS